MTGSNEIALEVREFVSHAKTVILSTVSERGEPNASYAPFVEHACENSNPANQRSKLRHPRRWASASLPEAKAIRSRLWDRRAHKTVCTGKQKIA